MIFSWLFRKKCNHFFDTPELQRVNDWRVSSNLYHVIYICKECKFKRWEVGYFDEDGNPQERIPTLEGECELSER